MPGLAIWRTALITVPTLAVIAEIFLRWAVGLGDPPLAVLDEAAEYRLLPSATYSRFGNQIEINRYGMRGGDHSGESGPDERRVLLIGDSIVYGNHFLDQAETIAYQMEHYLVATPRLTRCIPRAMALAASSWGPMNQLAYLERVGTLDADVAVLIISAHDLYDVPGPSTSILPYRLEPSLTALGDAIGEVRERWQLRSQGLNHVSDDEAKKMTLSALDGIAGYLKSEGLPMIVAYHSGRSELGESARPEQEVFHAWALEWQVPFFELEDALTPEGFRDEIHPNAFGAARIAASLAARVDDYLLECLSDGS